jgi:translation initiation factor 1
MKPQARGGLVYSTEGGRMCPGCRQPLVSCVCRQHAPAQFGDGIVRVGRETAGRKGKGVTLVRGLAVPPDELAELGRRIKTLCGSGGTVKDGVIEVQGEHRDRIVAFLQGAGWKAKRVG